MRNLALWAVCLLSLPLTSCKNNAPADADTTGSTSITSVPTVVTNQDSIKEVYARRMSTRTEAFPSRQILEAGKLNPVDEAPQDTSFFLFREDLLEAVRNKDIFFVTKALDPNIKASFGDPEGIATFVRIWGLESPDKTKDSRLWDVLEKVLEGGGTFEENGQRFIAPYVFSTFPEEYDSFEYGAITGSGVRMREGPGLNTRTLTTLSHNIVKINGYSEHEDTIGGEVHSWVAIETLDGTEGHVYGQFVDKPIDFRAGFEKKDGRWWMVFLVAGD